MSTDWIGNSKFFKDLSDKIEIAYVFAEDDDEELGENEVPVGKLNEFLRKFDAYISQLLVDEEILADIYNELEENNKKKIDFVSLNHQNKTLFVLRKSKEEIDFLMDLFTNFVRAEFNVPEDCHFKIRKGANVVIFELDEEEGDDSKVVEFKPPQNSIIGQSTLVFFIDIISILYII